jgi:TrmH family RNA methyltransferase
VLAGISKKDNPQTMIGAYRQRFATLDALRPQSPALVVALESVRDPGNFGTIVRTADAAGCDAVVLLGACCDPFSVEAVRATMGSIFAAPIVRTELGAFDAWRRARGMTLIGGSLNGKAPDDTLDVAGDTALLMGNEQAGLTDEAEAACDRLVQIPMRGRADSLNLAIATGVLIYDVWRRRDYAGAR